MLEFRKFRNTDPPILTEVWNEVFIRRGAAHLATNTPLDRFVFSKPYFDPEGLILAEQDGNCVGFVHGGFSPNQPREGVVSLLAVRPPVQRQGIGTQLLQHCETFLKQRGAKTLWGGGDEQGNPFYFGIYGGSDCVGFLDSDSAAGPFFTKQGYQPERRIEVWQRDLTKPIRFADGRFATIRNQFEMRVRSPHDVGSFDRECTLGQVDPVEFVMIDKKDDGLVARTFAWEMEGFSARWGKAAVGIVDFNVTPEQRRKGLAKFFLGNLLRQLQEQYLQIVEVQLDENNLAGITFLKSLGFTKVDLAQTYVRQA